MHIYTTGKVARICGVHPRTVCNWCDSGQLKFYRIPGSRNRLIPRNQLVAFMSARKLPLVSIDIFDKSPAGDGANIGETQDATRLD